MTRPEDELLADMDDLTGPRCVWCRGPLGSSTSDDFCCEDHQRAWNAQGTEALPPDERSPLAMLVDAAMTEADQGRLRAAVSAELSRQDERFKDVTGQGRRVHRIGVTLITTAVLGSLARSLLLPLPSVWLDVLAQLVGVLALPYAIARWHRRQMAALLAAAERIAAEPASAAIESEHGVTVRFTVHPGPPPEDDDEDDELDEDLVEDLDAAAKAP